MAILNRHLEYTRLDFRREIGTAEIEVLKVTRLMRSSRDECI